MLKYRSNKKPSAQQSDRQRDRCLPQRGRSSLPEHLLASRTVFVCLVVAVRLLLPRRHRCLSAALLLLTRSRHSALQALLLWQKRHQLSQRLPTPQPHRNLLFHVNKEIAPIRLPAFTNRLSRPPRNLPLLFQRGLLPPRNLPLLFQ